MLYFAGIFIGVHFEAKRQRILGIPKDQLPSKRKLMLQKGYMLLPLLVIVGTISVGFTAQRAALLGIACAFAVSLIRKETRPSLGKLLTIFEQCARVAPPVCLAAYAGAGIARATPMKTGFTAVKLAIGAFIIPYAFIFNPMLVMVDVTPLGLASAVLFSLLGIMGVSSALIGYFVRDSLPWERLVMLAAGLAMVVPELLTSGAGLIAMALIGWLQQRRPDSGKLAPAT